MTSILERFLQAETAIKSDLEYLKWNEQKLRKLLVAPSLHNGVLEAEVKKLRIL